MVVTVLKFSLPSIWSHVNENFNLFFFKLKFEISTPINNFCEACHREYSSLVEKKHNCGRRLCFEIFTPIMSHLLDLRGFLRRA